MIKKAIEMLLVENQVLKWLVIATAVIVFVLPFRTFLNEKESYSYASVFRTGIENSIKGYLPPHIVNQMYYDMEKKLERFAEESYSDAESQISFDAYRVGNSDNIQLVVSSVHDAKASESSSQIIKAFIDHRCDETMRENQIKQDSLYQILDSVTVDIKKDQVILYEKIMNQPEAQRATSHLDILLLMEQMAVASGDFRDEQFELEKKKNIRGRKMLEYLNFLELSETPCERNIVLRSDFRLEEGNTLVAAIKTGLLYLFSFILVLLTLSLAVLLVRQTTTL